jgi:lipoic acid synthetase
MSKGIKKVSKPEWLKVRACGGEKYLEVLSLIKNNDLHTVCQEANCPNRGECFSSGTATFLILGPNCTRNCSFCNISSGMTAPVDIDEPERVARAVEILRLEHAVVTSVTRDDLPDGGAGQFAEVIRAIRRKSNITTIEVLTPDFRGAEKSILTVLEASPDVYNHNVETVPSLYRTVRPAGNYRRSLALLQMVANHKVVVKSGLMVGLGETEDELIEVFEDLGRVGVELLTIGQYLSPSANHHPVVRYYGPSEFDRLAELAGRSGIESVFAGPLVRSSYHAAEAFRGK